jgi:cold shock CspA family protein
VLVHIKTLRLSGIRSLSAGDRVSFDVGTAPQKGKVMSATLQIIDQAEAA